MNTTPLALRGVLALLAAASVGCQPGADGPAAEPHGSQRQAVVIGTVGAGIDLIFADADNGWAGRNTGGEWGLHDGRRSHLDHGPEPGGLDLPAQLPRRGRGRRGGGRRVRLAIA